MLAFFVTNMFGEAAFQVYGLAETAMVAVAVGCRVIQAPLSTHVNSDSQYKIYEAASE
jgi:hypothetical protein